MQNAIKKHENKNENNKMQPLWSMQKSMKK